MPARMLFTCRPLTGHYLPLVPLALAARDAGHRVAFATAPPILEEAEAAGFEVLPAGVDTETRAQWAPRFPGFDRLVGDAQREFFFTKIFADLELVPRAADLAGIVRSWRPDLVVHEVAELAAPLVCSTAGIPYAEVAYGSLIPLAILEAASRAAEPHWRERGIEPRPFAGLFRHLYVDTCPPALQSTEIRRIAPVQKLRPAAGDVRRAARVAHAARPTVYVTMGTVWNRDLELFRRILAALADQPLDLVATVGHSNDPAALGPQPANVSVHRWIDQNEILPRCDLVITHGGSGTMLGGLAHGVPLLFIPQGADQWSNAERVVAAGAGRMILVGDLSADELRTSVSALLNDREYADAAQRISAQIAAMPEPVDALPALERLL